ncbi:hypothetical protein L596_009224 [Steinernema carpocapsae]|uniref:Uncharacterized protein n=1 Tax=Steinernema carpocapsae TaxID=34508 RepID=A0A4U5PEQ7_STECR|nr:hypothetical protein L596_009224 [Steinernema carpocapsae]
MNRSRGHRSFGRGGFYSGKYRKDSAPEQRPPSEAHRSVSSSADERSHSGGSNSGESIGAGSNPGGPSLNGLFGGQNAPQRNFTPLALRQNRQIVQKPDRERPVSSPILPPSPPSPPRPSSSLGAPEVPSRQNREAVKPKMSEKSQEKPQGREKSRQRTEKPQQKRQEKPQEAEKEGQEQGSPRGSASHQRRRVMKKVVRYFF